MSDTTIAVVDGQIWHDGMMEYLYEYNDRLHQGLAVPGLSPDEFTGRSRKR